MSDLDPEVVRVLAERAEGNPLTLVECLHLLVEAGIVETTAGGPSLQLNLAISYGGRAEIVDAARRLAERVARGTLVPEEIDESLLEEQLYTAGTPHPDLLIRTSREQRISNFMLWQLAYSEIHITPVLWPDFDRGHLFDALLDYQRRERRFGRVVAS